ncbi:toxin-antitoxin system YwqK family antitoxin [Abyssalbus ytuae]|uniref:Nicotinic acid mononucleotide adenyltransferase n=1 Tax=Abyssalbus ytuae TaxID=2926907 RepID=A0A9E7D0G2_9FLAO|nr:nicotinic acid mononucleotide adenyltransferase [Abyssalbus ytuae]UOB15983.1 nicotinic acid mononucleotide adenyltransferase [Abyssalbus ytuae]
MRNLILTFAMLFSVALMAQQDNKPTFEKEGDMIKATYFHDNGQIAQTGYILNEKPHGEWIAFNAEGEKTAVAQYEEGKKVGKWFMWADDKLTEIDYEQNKIVNVVNWDKTKTLVTK